MSGQSLTSWPTAREIGLASRGNPGLSLLGGRHTGWRGAGLLINLAAEPDGTAGEFDVAVGAGAARPWVDRLPQTLKYNPIRWLGLLPISGC